MTRSYQLRRATRADYGDLADVMFDAVRRGPSRYTERQRTAWMPEHCGGASWEARLDAQVVVLGSDAIGTAGFMSLAAGGYIDFAYLRPVAQGTGLFRRLFAWIEGHSRERGDARLWVHASLMAQPAFAAMGFEVVEHETVTIGEERLDRAVMEKLLTAATPDGSN